MDPDVRNALIAKIAMDAEENSVGNRTIPAAVLGGIMGAGLGGAVRGANQFIRRPEPAKGLGRLKPGSRMTGAAFFALMGGGLGEALRQEAISSSPAAALLAKGQSQGFTDADQKQLTHVLAQTYSDMGIM